MSRPRKATVDYFPHYVNHGKTMYTIENKYGNDGYSFWFKILEQLGAAEHHFLDCNDIETWEFLLAKTLVNENTAISILDTCSKLGAIDQALWNNKIVRSDNFIENLDSVYKRREVSVYNNDDVLSLCKQKSRSVGVSSNVNPQSIVKDSILDQSKREETIKKESEQEERIHKENQKSKSESAFVNKEEEPRKEKIQIQKENPKPNPEAEEKAEIQEPRSQSRAHACESKSDFGYEDMIGNSKPEKELKSEELKSTKNEDLFDKGENDPESEPQKSANVYSDHEQTPAPVQKPEPDKKDLALSSEPKKQVEPKQAKQSESSIDDDGW